MSVDLAPAHDQARYFRFFWLQANHVIELYK